MPQVNKTVPPPRVRGPVQTPPGDILSRLEGVDFSQDRTIQLLLYGRTGSGKTTLWSTFPKPICAVVCSGGRRPGELRSVAHADRGGIKAWRLERSADFRELVGQLHSRDGAGYKTFVLDHAGGFQDLMLKEVLGLSDVPLQKSWDLASGKQYGACTLKCKEAFAPMLDLPMNVVVVAHERGFGGDGGDSGSEVIQPFVGAALTPSLAGWLHGTINNICQCFLRRGLVEKKTVIAGKEKIRQEHTGPIEYCLRTGPDDVYASRMRVPRGTPLPDVIVDPSYAKIAALVGLK